MDDDLKTLTKWAERIDQLFVRGPGPYGIGAAEQLPFDQGNAWAFLPDSHIEDALIRLESQFPTATRQIGERFERAKSLCNKYEDRGCRDLDRAPLFDALFELVDRIHGVVAATGESLTGRPAEHQATEPRSDDPEQMVSPETIAKRYGLDNRQKDRLRHKLTAWRSPANSTEWTEVQDRKPRQPAFLYRLGSIQHLIDAEKSAE